ncbi:hypothetical protein LZ30DRAFT_668537 [Colletotrichum cereale]|nr:hypothetical protein LZ30DRAFT_668537 [Colletotrichum cereale]
MHTLGKANLFMISIWALLASAMVQGSDKPFSQLSKREPKPVNRILVVSGLSSWWSKHSCGITATTRIKSSIKQMRRYAIAASSFLEADDSYSTAAYIAWFGVENANPTTAKGIINNIYNPIKALGRYAPGQINELTPTEGAVVIGCSSDKEECKGKRALAWAGNKAIIELCPDFFEDLFRNEEIALEDWQKRRELVKTESRTLLHEMTHLKAVAGDWETDDYASSYEVPELVALDDWQKIRNAENYALFALDAYADPSHAAQHVDLQSSNPLQEALSLLGAGTSSARE